jgi:hypothetical protein
LEIGDSNAVICPEVHQFSSVVSDAINAIEWMKDRKVSLICDGNDASTSYGRFAIMQNVSYLTLLRERADE